MTIDDDLFIFKKERVQEVIDNLKEAGILGEIQFNCTGRANMINDEVMKLLKEETEKHSERIEEKLAEC